MKETIDPKILNAFYKGANIVILTGAGVSSESGIPTFRDAQEGLWADYDPEELASPAGFRKNPQLVYDWYTWRRNVVLKSKPNPAHFAIAQLQRLYPNLTLITQNVDGLHQVAGSSNVIEMHGSIHKMKCLSSNHASEWVNLEVGIPNCKTCGSLLRPDIVWFGEQLAEANLRLINKALTECNIFLSIGTSGVVYPAAGFLERVAKRGAKTIVVNTDVHSQGDAEHLIKGEAGELLPILVDQLQR